MWSAQLTKLTMYKNLIHPVLLYGSETWVLTKKEENRFIIFERKVLRTIYGSKLVDGVYREVGSISNSIVSPNVVDVVNYAGNTMGCRRPTTETYLFRSKPKGRQNKGRP
jgi:hypothetical protein